MNFKRTKDPCNLTATSMGHRESFLVEAKGVRLDIRGRVVLDQVDLNVAPAEIVVLIGPNGAGKSTLIKVILGLQKADEGQVALRPGVRIGYMPQRLVVDPVLPLTVSRFLALGGVCTKEKMLRILAEVGGEHLIDSPVQDISGGEMQRVMLARALLRDPQLLILDEPVQGVDVTGQSELYELISSIRDRYGCGILMVSHDLHLVMAAADRVVCLNRHVCCAGHPEAVSGDPAYLELFGATPGFAVYTHHHDHQHDLSGHILENRDMPEGENRG